MYAASDRFQRAVRTSGQRKTVIDVRSSLSSLNLYEAVPIINGNIVVDRSAEVRRSGELEIADPQLATLFTTSDTGPYGLEIYVYTGIVYRSGDEELVPMGVFNVEEYSWTENASGDNILRLQIYDRSRWIHRAPMATATNYAGKQVQAVIQDMISEIFGGSFPSPIIDGDLPNPRLPGGSVFDNSRWEVIQTCAEAMGAEAYFNVEGEFVVNPIPDPGVAVEDASWEFNVGDGFTEYQGDQGNEYLVTRPDGTLISATRGSSRSETYNAVAVLGAAKNATTGQPYAIAYDSDPESPTYYEGTFGKSVLRIDNQALVTPAQCAEVAAAKLRDTLGVVRSVDFTAIGNPALDGGDSIVFTWFDETQEVHLLDRFSYPLAEGDFSAETRTSPTRETSSITVQQGTSGLQRPPGVPTHARVTNISINSATVNFVAGAVGSSPIARYDIDLHDYVHGEIIDTYEFASDPLGVLIEPAILTPLSTGRRYAVRIKTVDEGGLESPTTNWIQFKTDGTAGEESPTGIEYRSLTYRWQATWSSSYTSSGSRATWKGNDCYQGYVSGGNGNERSLIGFSSSSIVSNCAGMTISSCQVYLYFKHWYKSSGGTAVIGTHEYAGRPGSWSSSNVSSNRVRSSGWPKPGSRTVSLGTTIGKMFKNGNAKGIALGPAPSTSSTYYGVARGAGSGSLSPKLIISGKKAVG